MRRALAAPMVLVDEAAIDAFEPTWRGFAAEHAHSPFDSPDWLRPWYRHYANDARPRLLVWRDEDRVVGVAPLVVRRAGRLVRRTELGLWGSRGPAVRGMADVVATDEHRDAVVDGLGDWLGRGHPRWDILNLLRLPPGSDLVEQMRFLADDAGWSAASLTGIVRSTAYVLELPEDQAGHGAQLGPKARHNLRTEARRFERAGGRFGQTSDPAAAVEAVAAIRRLMAERWGAAELDFAPDPAFEPFLVEALESMLAHGSAVLDLARDDHGIRACLATTFLNRRAVALIIGVSRAPDTLRMSLGKQLFHRSIGAAIERGCRTYDLLWAGGYKESFWHAAPRTMESAVIGRGLRGRSIVEADRLRRLLPGVRTWRAPRRR
ncbi:MAG: GNAT family N-acetyltransferase [Chloroflexota bacterium]